MLEDEFIEKKSTLAWPKATILDPNSGGNDLVGLNSQLFILGLKAD